MQEQIGKLEPAVLRRARAGDHGAFRDLVRLYDPGLRSLACRLLGEGGCMDDVLQEAYGKAYRSLGAVRGDSGVRTWIYRITYNACMDDIRRRSLVHHPFGMSHQRVAHGSSSRAGHASRTSRLPRRLAASPGPGGRTVLRSGPAAALAGLPPDQRAAVLLVDAEGFDDAAAAEVLGVAEGTVASWVSRARDTLRRALRDIGEEER